MGIRHVISGIYQRRLRSFLAFDETVGVLWWPFLPIPARMRVQGVVCYSPERHKVHVLVTATLCTMTGYLVRDAESAEDWDRLPYWVICQRPLGPPLVHRDLVTVLISSALWKT
jgi:hypothetical protein